MPDTSVSTKSLVAKFVPLTSLHPSPTNPRKFFGNLDDLAKSIKERGIVEPLIVRQNGKPTAEIVCGERRFRAAKMAGLTEVPVVFKEFTDDEVVFVQLVENGQREDLSPLEEADTYADLAKRDLSVAAIAKQIGREPSQVARRLPLAKLTKRCKDAMNAGVLPVEHAELIARIPDPKLYDEALAAILENWTDDEHREIVRVVPFAAAKRIVEERFMASLAIAVFDPEDKTLSPLGPCSTCPHLAGNNPNLFGDVKGKAVCTNPKDFRVKTENHLKRLRENGYRVLIAAKELKQAFPYVGSDKLSKEFVDLDTVCPDDPKRRRFDELLAKGDKLKTVFAFKEGRVRKLFPAKYLKPAFIAAGHAFAKDRPKPIARKNEAARSEAQLDQIGAETVRQELATKLRTLKLTPSGWIDLILRIVLIAEGWKLEAVIRRHGFSGSREEFAKHRERIVKERTEAMSEAEKRALLVDLLVGDWMGSGDKAQAEMHRYVLKLANINHATVANRAIDSAKKQAVEAKQTPKPPIAGKTLRAPKS